jgi:hypothetical protein
VKCEYSLVNGKNQSSVLTVNACLKTIPPIRFPVHDFFPMEYLIRSCHKVLTYIEYRAVSGVFRNIDPLTPSPPGACVPPAFGPGARTHSLVGEEVGGQYFGRRQTLDWPLTV